jgi:hypothetical protein
MNNLEHLVEQQIRHYESRLKHIDELLERAESSGHAEVAETAKTLRPQRDEMHGYLEKMRLKSLDDWREEEIEKAGPMGIWDAVAQQLENLVERLEH